MYTGEDGMLMAATFFGQAARGAAMSRKEYKACAPALRQSLFEAQQRLGKTRAFSVVVVVAGIDTAGRGETLNLLNAWMDPRWIVTRAWGAPSDEEAERPPLWRYWRPLPPRGQIGLFHGAWYEPALDDRVERRCSLAAFDRRLGRIAALEKALADDGTLVLKFWLHLTAAAQRKRLKAFGRDPLTRWRVTERRRERARLHERVARAAEHAIRRTDAVRAPWRVVDAADRRSRNAAVAAGVRNAIAGALDRAAVRGPKPRPAVRRRTVESRDAEAAASPTDRLGALDLTLAIDRKRYRAELAAQQGRLSRLQRLAAARGLSTVAVFEGWDAAGKGGAIRRVTAALDARHCRVIPIGPPTAEELARHYLWRFMRRLSRAGRITIFDRSWYGRALVERVEGLASPRECMRAWPEINDFEDQIVSHGILLLKFWMHVSRREQLRRFHERRRTPHKVWKITDEDWRNRRRWRDYEHAVSEMVARTGTRRAPWTLVEANDKLFARIKVLRTLADRLARRLET